MTTQPGSGDIEAMEAARWKRAQELLRAVLELEPSMRSAFLDRECRDEPDLRAEVDALLAEQSHTGAFDELHNQVQNLASSTKQDQLEQLRDALTGRYRVTDKLGAGGMATVFLAHDLKHEREVAIKVLKPGLTAALGAERFVREIKITAKLNHPHILPLLDSGIANGFLYYVMPYVEGESLRDRLQREKQLSVNDALQIAREVADALDSAHRHDVIHRDIKPGNILFQEGHALVADFGIAHAVSEAGGDDLTESGIALGTPRYMSPEQSSGESPVDGRSDVYSLACVVYEMLAGKPPFTGTTAHAILSQRLSGSVSSAQRLRADIPDAVEAALQKALEKEPSDRFHTAGDFSAALLSPVAAHPAAHRPSKRRLRVVFPAAGALGIVALLGLFFVTRNGTPTSGDILPTEPTRLLIAEFANHTPDSMLGAVVTEALRIDLGQSRSIRLVEPVQVRATLARMERDSVAQLDIALARDIAVREGAKAVVAGEVYAAGLGYVLAAKLIAAERESTLVSLRQTAADSTQLIAAIDRLSADLREQIGEPLKAIRASPPLEQVTTASLAALRAYTEAARVGWIEGSDQGRAIGLLEQAVALDTGFATAHRVLATALNNQGLDPAHNAALRTRAFELRHRLPELERYLAEGSYWMWVGDRDKQMAAWHKVLEVKPEDFRALDYLGLTHLAEGDFERAEDLFMRAYEDRPAYVILIHMSQAQLAQGRMAAARATLSKLEREYPNYPMTFANNDAAIFYATGDYASALAHWRSLERRAASPAWQAHAALGSAGMLAVMGKLREADTHFERGQALHEELGRAWDYVANAAWRAMVDAQLYNDPAEGLQRLERLFARYTLDSLRMLTQLYRGLSVVPAALVNPAVAYTFLDRADRATALADEVEAALPAPRWVEGDRLLVLGAVELSQGRAEDAIRQLRQSMNERQWSPTVFVYLGRAHEILGARDSAIVAYERYLVTPFAPAAHRRCCAVFGRVASDAVWRAWIYKRLGELYSDRGERAKARQYYSAFIDLWKEADPELQPQVEEVQRRIAMDGG